MTPFAQQHQPPAWKDLEKNTIALESWKGHFPNLLPRFSPSQPPEHDLLKSDGACDVSIE